MSTKDHHQPGLDGRHRDANGRIRVKQGNTRVGTLRETYGEGFAPGVRGTPISERFWIARVRVR